LHWSEQVSDESTANPGCGGLVIGGIYNGMYLLGLAVQWEFIVTGLVLVGAVTIDALSRRSSASAGAART
jgi:D-xylose transport system permease protein